MQLYVRDHWDFLLILIFLKLRPIVPVKVTPHAYACRDILEIWGFPPSCSKTWLTKFGVVELDWPAESNDLNPRIPLTSSWSTIVPLMLSLNPQRYSATPSYLLYSALSTP